jgi:hypothetical protein
LGNTLSCPQKRNVLPCQHLFDKTDIQSKIVGWLNGNNPLCLNLVCIPEKPHPNPSFPFATSLFYFTITLTHRIVRHTFSFSFLLAIQQAKKNFSHKIRTIHNHERNMDTVL